MDYKGQQFCEFLYQFLLILFGITSLFGGVYFDSIKIAINVYVLGFIITLAVCLPDWPFFNRNPMSWQPRTKSTVTTESINKEGTKPEESSSDDESSDKSETPIS